jgi:hypothetical protein
VNASAFEKEEQLHYFIELGIEHAEHKLKEKK